MVDDHVSQGTDQHNKYSKNKGESKRG
jgi:hypothetical protein